MCRFCAGLAKFPVHVYRWTLKPFLGAECRHLPTCSDYALQAIELNGAWRGCWLMVSRIWRCRPGGTDGYDPPPDLRTASHRFTPWLYGRWTSVFQTPEVVPSVLAPSMRGTSV
jgi:uncharacterized protein